MADKPSVFISYSHRDTEWKDRFVGHLEVSVKQGHFEQWNDEQIGAGEDWYAKISAAMDAASVGRVPDLCTSFFARTSSCAKRSPG